MSSNLAVGRSNFADLPDLSELQNSNSTTRLIGEFNFFCSEAGNSGMLWEKSCLADIGGDKMSDCNRRSGRIKGASPAHRDPVILRRPGQTES